MATQQSEGNFETSRNLMDEEQRADNEARTTSQIVMAKVKDDDKMSRHIFHYECIALWVKTRDVCPLCQTVVAE